MLDFLFRNNIVMKAEKQRRIVGEVEVLKKQQKVEVEKTTKQYAAKKVNMENTIDAQIASLEAQIASLKNSKKAQAELFAEELKVALDKVINLYDRKIVNKTNQAKKLGYFIDAERRNQEDVLNPDQPNAPKKILLESEQVETKSKKK